MPVFKDNKISENEDEISFLKEVDDDGVPNSMIFYYD